MDTIKSSRVTSSHVQSRGRDGTMARRSGVQGPAGPGVQGPGSRVQGPGVQGPAGPAVVIISAVGGSAGRHQFACAARACSQRPVWIEFRRAVRRGRRLRAEPTRRARSAAAPVIYTHAYERAQHAHAHACTRRALHACMCTRRARSAVAPGLCAAGGVGQRLCASRASERYQRPDGAGARFAYAANTVLPARGATASRGGGGDPY